MKTTLALLISLSIVISLNCKKADSPREAPQESVNEEGISPEMQHPDPDKRISLNRIRSDFSDLIDSEIEFKGRFWGFQLSEAGCLSPVRTEAPVWAVADSVICMCVVGPVPAGLDPQEPHQETITVEGILRMEGTHIYIDLR
ncbi:hypothetical protein JW877_10140 [bacterium]|nr:hypothetical protein [bacterium]